MLLWSSGLFGQFSVKFIDGSLTPLPGGECTLSTPPCIPIPNLLLHHFDLCNVGDILYMLFSCRPSSDKRRHTMDLPNPRWSGILPSYYPAYFSSYPNINAANPMMPAPIEYPMMYYHWQPSGEGRPSTMPRENIAIRSVFNHPYGPALRRIIALNLLIFGTSFDK